MQRTALIVAGAAGPQDVANGVLQRFGFAPALTALGVAEAATLVRNQKFDLVVIPLQGIANGELSSLERELRKQPQTFVIGTAAQNDPELILRALRSGIHEFLLYPPDPREFSGAVDRIMRRTHSESKAGAAIAVYSAKGGLGTTSVAVNLAFAVARGRPDGRVALADLVAGGGDVRVILDIRPQYDMDDLVRKASQIDAELLDSVLTPCTGGVWVLPASDDPETAAGIDSAMTLNILEHLRSHFAVTVLDCEHHMTDRTLAALDAADRIVLVTQLNVPALRSTQRTLGLFGRLGYPDEKVAVVVNRHHPQDVVSVADAKAVLQRDLFFKLPNDYQTSTAALTRGVPVTEHNAASALAVAYGNLAARLDGRSDGRANGQVNGQANGQSSRIGRLFSLGRK